MAGVRTRSAVRLAAVGVLLAVAGAAAADAARPGATLRVQAQALDTRAHRALLDLYALDSRLHAARAHVGALQSQTASLRREQVQLAQQLSATRRTLSVSQTELAQNLSVLYKQDDVSTLAVVLGATSVDDALTRLDDLNRLADQSEQVVAVATDARSRLDGLRTTLAQDRARLDAALADARATEATLAAARAQRIALVADLRRQQQLKVAQIHALEAAAQRIVKKSETLQAAAAAVPDASTTAAPALGTTPAMDVAPASGRASALAPAASAGQTITVDSTGYSLGGRTATGMSAGWGVVAVDPSVIPLGTRLTIPGYGEAVAADTGGAVRGNRIDIWFPTLAQARAWGRRTVTITLH